MQSYYFPIYVLDFPLIPQQFAKTNNFLFMNEQHIFHL